MANNIRINQLADKVMKGLTEYADLATDDMKKAVKKAGTTVRKEIEANLSGAAAAHPAVGPEHPDGGAV